METRIPSAGTPLRGLDLVSATSGLWRHYLDRYRTLLQAYLQTPHISLVNSGTTACYITLLALARRSSCREVILPAYTAPSLTLPIRKAGLIPRACEISLETFNLDPNRLEEVLGPDTLCILPVHMFGLASDIEAIRLRTEVSVYGRIGDVLAQGCLIVTWLTLSLCVWRLRMLKTT